jgi:hypothetical protein
MPTPLPSLQNSLAVIAYPLDCIRKEGPPAPTDPPGLLDEQRFELTPNGLNRADAKLRWQTPVIPYRFITLADRVVGSPVPLEDGFAELAANPDLWWNQVPWGQFASLGRRLDNNQWELHVGELVSGIGSYLTAQCVNTQIGNSSVSPPDWNRTAAVLQLLCPQLYIPINYQVWSVTGRFLTTDALGVGYDDTGTFPVPPWQLSSDFTLQGGGVLQPGDTLVINPHDLSPDASCQRPPAPNGSLQSTDGQNWGVSNYIVFNP